MREPGYSPVQSYEIPLTIAIDALRSLSNVGDWALTSRVGGLRQECPTVWLHQLRVVIHSAGAHKSLSSSLPLTMSLTLSLSLSMPV